MFVQDVINLIHRIPHVNFRFRSVSDVFNYDLQSEYAQAIAIFAIFSLLFGLLLLLIITITWVCQCCLRKEINQRSRRRIRNFTVGLFTISVICFALLGGCLYGNERINRSVAKSVNGLEDVFRNLKLAASQINIIRDTQENATKHVDDLVKLIDKKTRETPDYNKTLLEEVDSALTAVSDHVDDVKNKLLNVNVTLTDIKKIEKAKLYVDRFEYDRWTFYVVLPSIIIGVLFIGVISFCRQSRKGSITFSALGIVTFIVTWALIALVFPITVIHADICSTHDEFLNRHLRPEVYKAMQFYQSCKVTESHSNVPPNLPLNDMSDRFTQIQNSEGKLETMLNALFNSSAELTDAMQTFEKDITQSFKAIGALESTLSCYSMQNDVNDAKNGICHDAVIGSFVMFLSTLLLGFFMFILLLVVSQTWYLFNINQSDYIEVRDDDPFYRPHQDTVIPADIYGTHVFNHRSRFPQSSDQNEPSTSTTTATNILGQPNNPNQPLLDNNWQRSSATAPIASGNNSVSAATGNRFI
jgi:peptidoglycan hydrolase CwlO-like protein